MKKLFNLLSFSFVLLLFASVQLIGQKTVKGTITDGSNGEPIIGANVLVEGTTVGTITDFDGMYMLEVPEGGTNLVISYTGYTTQTVAITSDKIDVVLSAGAMLDEVVVVGYGSQKAKEVTSAVVSVDESKFNKGNVGSPAGLLQGKVAGLTISKPGSNPNGDPIIQLRGVSTLGENSAPLVILDGVPGASMSNIDPNDIASMNVLKDGSAAAIYGTRGANGVIIITTKKGKKGTAKIDYNGYVAVENIDRKVDIATASEFKKYHPELDNGSETDWIKEITGTGVSHAHNISLTGGTEQTAYRASLSFRDQKGILDNTGFDQLNGNINITQKALNDKLELGLTAIATARNIDYGFEEALRYANTSNPTNPVMKDGKFFEPGGFDYFNPVAMVAQNVNEGKRKESLLNITAGYNLLPGLKITGSFAQQNDNFEGGEYYSTNSLYRSGNARNGVAVVKKDDKTNTSLEGTAQYAFDAGNIAWTLLGGASYQKFEFDGRRDEAGGFISDLGYDAIGRAQDYSTGKAIVSSYRHDYELQAYFGRVNANIDNTFFVSASLRREGSSRLGANNKYGNFPAASIGVDLAKLGDLKSINTLKLRAGYGVTGNLPGSSYLSLLTFGPSGGSFFYNGAFVPAYGPASNPNPDLKWETKKEINVGLDFAFSDFKWTGALDVYRSKTLDLIKRVSVPVPPNLFQETEKNVADFTTTGLELTLNYAAVQSQKFNWTTGLIFGTSTSKIDKYIDDQPESYAGNIGAPGQNINPPAEGIIRIAEGEKIGKIYAPTYTSIDDQGNYVWEGGNNDFANWKEVGNALPKFSLSWSNNFEIGKFDASVFFRGAFGHKIVNMNRAFYEGVGLAGNNMVITKYFDEALKGIPKYNSKVVEKGDFVKLDNMTIGYKFDLPDGSSFNNIRVYLTGQNLFTFTGYTGIDPDPILSSFGSSDNGGRPSREGPLVPGIERRTSYFTTRTFTLGVNVGF